MKAHAILLITLLALVLASCAPAPEAAPTTDIPPTDPPAAPTDEPAAPQPTATPVIEYVALVNGEGIRKSSFDASLLQLNAALETYPQLVSADQTPEEVVLQELINRTLLAQTARAGGFTADLQITVDQMASLIDQAGGNDAFEAWLADNGYTLETYSYEVPLELEAAWQRDQIAAAVPDQLEQVRAQQILFYDPYQAERAIKQLDAGFAFESIAQNNDPNNLGYLDWFPRGVLLFPALEEVAFSLQPGQFSEVIETEAGYHILYIFEKGLHPLSFESRLILEEQAVADWLADQRARASIQVDLP
ncbi:MAG: peptidylprolyl isomerase [Anaerolineales bacterium]|nr:peptidylprolyl isomerase [Anaerolineales bacterium]